MVNGCFFFDFFLGGVIFFGTAKDLAIPFGAGIQSMDLRFGPRKDHRAPPRIDDDKAKTLGFLLMFTVNNFKPMEFYGKSQAKSSRIIMIIPQTE